MLQQEIDAYDKDQVRRREELIQRATETTQYNGPGGSHGSLSSSTRLALTVKLETGKISSIDMSSGLFTRLEELDVRSSKASPIRTKH